MAIRGAAEVGRLQQKRAPAPLENTSLSTEPMSILWTQKVESLCWFF